MKKTILFLLCISLFFLANAQSYSVQWGDEMKLKKGSMDFDIINADETGVYLLEGKMKMTSYFVIGASYGTAFKLYKFDKNYNSIYEQDYKKLMKGLSFKGIQFLQKDMYLFGHDYIKKERKYIIYGVKLDTKTGEPKGELQELASFELNSKRDDFDYSFTPTPDSSKWMLAGDVSTETNSVISIVILDKDLKNKGRTQISMSYDKKSFTLEDIMMVSDGKFLVLGKQYEMVPTGKRNKTVRTFTKYVFSKYDAKGKKEMDLPTDVSSRYAMSGKAIYHPNGQLSLAGFYSNDPKKKEVNGVFLHKVDVNTGTVLQSSFKEVSAQMLDQAVEDENELDKEEKSARKEREKAKEKDGDEDGISRDFVMRNVEINPFTGALYMIAELSKFQTWITSHYNGKTWTTRTYYQYTNSDLLVISADAQGQIAWINTLPKRQVETISSSGSGFGYYSPVTDFFARGGGMPFYSSFNYMIRDQKMVFLINDHLQNEEVKKLGDKVKTINNFRKSVAYVVTLDLTNGQFSRKILLSNEDDPVLMPRFSYVTGKDFFLPAMKMKALGKTEFKMGKVSIKSL